MKEIKDIRISNEVVSANFQNVPTDLKSKGIYFWFADHEGIETLLELLACKIFDKHYVVHEGKKLFLIYIGTAGTGKKGLSNLNERFKWHLTQKHSYSSIKHGSLSNFRLALSLLLKTKVEGETAAQAVNDFMSQNLYISWMPFENKTLISTEEKDLIKTYFPFINDSHNDKGYKRSQEEYATKSFKELKVKFREQQKGNGSPNPINNQTNMPKASKKMKDINTPQRNQSLTKDDEGCFLIPFTDRDNLHEKVNQYRGLEGSRKMFIFSDDKTKTEIYKIKKGDYRKTGEKERDIYTYFERTDNGRKRHKLISLEMQEKAIKNAILKVCPQDYSPQKQSSNNLMTEKSVYPTPSNRFKTLSEIDFKSMEGKPKLLILPCSDDKLKGGTLEKRQNYFQSDLAGLREKRFLMAKEKSLVYLPAIERYSKARLYGDLKDLILKVIDQNHLHVLFISGLYGVLRFDDHIINYNLRVVNGFGEEGNVLITQSILSYCKSENIPESNIFCFLSPDYFRVIEQNQFGLLNSWESGGRGYQTVWHNRERLKDFLNQL
ncbi:MAG: YaaA family protein [Cytophagales bacterium]|nr:YaaA family protein [Cytophagales bacterium]